MHLYTRMEQEAVKNGAPTRMLGRAGSYFQRTSDFDELPVVDDRNSFKVNKRASDVVIKDNYFHQNGISVSSS